MAFKTTSVATTTSTSTKSTVDFDQLKDQDLKIEFKGPYIGLNAHF